MFEGSATGFENGEWQGRFRAEFSEQPTQAQASAAENVWHSPGTLITPTNITAQVAADIDRVKSIPFHVPNIYGTITHEEQLYEARFKNVMKKLRRHLNLQTFLVAAAIGSIGYGLYLSDVGATANQNVQAELTSLSAMAAAGDSGSTPSAVKPTPAAVASYQVPGQMPKYIDIPNLSVHARIRALDTTKSGVLSAPDNIYDAGWYRQSAEPGQNGAMLIDGHISNWQAHGVFYGLNKVQNGDTIRITRGDNKVFNFQVVKTRLYDANNVDMSSLLVSQVTAKPGLNIISCSGDVIPGTNEFNKRLVVYAVQI